jgi:hypothetical protein
VTRLRGLVGQNHGLDAAVTAALDIRSYLPVDASGGSTEAARGPLGPGSSAEDGDHAVPPLPPPPQTQPWVFALIAIGVPLGILAVLWCSEIVSRKLREWRRPGAQSRRPTTIRPFLALARMTDPIVPIVPSTPQSEATQAPQCARRLARPTGPKASLA